MKNILILLPILAVTALFSCKSSQQIVAEKEKVAKVDTLLIPLKLERIKKEFNVANEDLINKRHVFNDGEIRFSRPNEKKSQGVDENDDALVLSTINEPETVIVPNHTKGVITGINEKTNTIWVCFDSIKKITLPFGLGSDGSYFFNIKSPEYGDRTMFVFYNDTKYSASVSYKKVLLLIRVKYPNRVSKKEITASGVEISSASSSPEQDTYYPGLKKQEPKKDEPKKPEAKSDIDEMLKELQKKKDAEPAKKAEEKKPEVKSGPRRSRPSPK
ncbi:MAG: hypothetical protein NT068_02945 [Candidatus Nomurabacteria bacterium]|nr:hypothetical protein [Candidatus Nomurabacteria bacterium]